MIRCYLANISQKRYILHWFQYRYWYFEHPSVSENGATSAKMACCLYVIINKTDVILHSVSLNSRIFQKLTKLCLDCQNTMSSISSNVVPFGCVCTANGSIYAIKLSKIHYHTTICLKNETVFALSHILFPEWQNEVTYEKYICLICLEYLCRSSMPFCFQKCLYDLRNILIQTAPRRGLFNAFSRRFHCSYFPR